MKRREFITLLGGAAAWPLAAGGQEPERMRRVGVLMALSATDPESSRRLHILNLQECKKRAFHFKDEDSMALPVDEGYVMLGHLVEREQGFEAVQVDGRSLGLFSSAGAGAAALIEAETQRHLPLRTAQ